MLLSRSHILNLRAFLTQVGGSAPAYLYIDGVEVSVTEGTHLGSGEFLYVITIPANASIGGIVQCVVRGSSEVYELFTGQVVELTTSIDSTPEYEVH